MKPLAGVRQVAITVVANQVEDVNGTEPLCPEKATLQGPCKVIPQEYPKLLCRLVDVVLPVGDDGTDRLVHQIVAEMHTTRVGGTVAYRGPHRWIKVFEPARRDIPVAQRLRKQGVYLITGGLGGIGLTLAEHLARHWQARLVLVGRTVLPPRDQWSAILAAGEHANDHGVKLARLLELESFGAEVMVLQADVADAHQMHKVVEVARQRFGAVHGVIHAAGHAGGGVIPLRTRSLVEQVFSSKVRGTQTLLESLAGETLDFVLLCSSLASLAGGVGKVDYAAANAFMDAVAAVTQRTSGRMVVSVNWDGWREVGMAGGMRLSEQVGIEPDQGALAFERIVNGPSLPQSIVSTTDLVARLTMTDDDVFAAAVMTSTNEVVSRHHPRPPLSTAYVAPVGDLEDRIANIWCESLGISAIGVHDNLFELGGDSLLAIQLLAKVRGVYGTNLPPAVFFKEPTIAALAVVVETKLIEEIEQADLLASIPADASASV